MKRRVLLLMLCMGLAMTVPASAEDVFLLGFTGFDYEDVDADPVNYLAVGDGYKLVGFVTSFGPDLDPYVDATLNEYTVHFFDLTVQTRSFLGGVLEVTFNDNGRGRYYEDPLAGGTPAVYGTFPPNATAPSTFIDGTLSLGGQINAFVLSYDFNVNQGSFFGSMNLDEGTNLTYIPVSRRAGWTLGGLAGRPNATVPDGYDNQVEGECRIPGVVPTSHRTWGAIKNLYR